MAARNISATVNIGATMASSVGAVFGGMKKQIDGLGASMAKLKKASGEIAKLTAAQGKLSDARAKGNAAAVKRYEAEVAKLTASLQEAGVDTADLAREQARLNRELDNGRSRMAALTRYSSSVGQLGAAFGKLRSSLGGALTRLGVVGGVAAGAVAGLAYLTTEFIDQGDALADQAEGLNMSTQALQTWQFAAGTVGIESDRLSATFAKLQAKIADGSDETVASFRKLGINLGRLKKLKPDAQLSVIAEAFSKLPPTVNKTALSTDIFGKSGFKLVPILNQGQKGLQALNEEARRTGYILDDETNAAVGDADAAFNRFKLALTGLKNQALAPLLPIFTDLIGSLGEFIRTSGPEFKKWAEDSAAVFRDEVAPALGAFVRDTLPEVIKGIGQVAGVVGNVLGKAADLVGGWGNLGVALLAVNFAPVIASLGAIAAGLWSMAGAVLALLGPWAILVGAIVAGAALVWYHWEPIKGFFVGMWEHITGRVRHYWNELEIGMEKLRRAFVGAWENIKASVGSVVDWIGQKIDALLGTFAGVGSWLREFSGAKVDPSILPNTPANDQFGIPGGAGLMPADRMPAAGGGAGTVNNNVEVKIDARGTDPAEVERRLRSSLQSRPLYDTTGVLAPQ